MEEKTTLLKIEEQKNEQVRKAIEQAIEDGVAKIEHSPYVSSGYTIDGVFIQVHPIDNVTLCLNMKSKVISMACKPTKEELEKMAEQKRAELEEIEKQINLKQ